MKANFNIVVRTAAAVALSVAVLSSGAAFGDAPKLYATGPSHDSGFLRFVNATRGTLTIKASGENKITIPVGQDDDIVSRFLAVPTDTDLTATAEVAGGSVPITLNFKANEFATVVISQAPSGPRATILRDSPENFNAVKAAVAFYNADPGCAQAALLTVPKQQTIFKDVAIGAIARRSVNPVAALVEGACGGTVFGQATNLGKLQGGGRYSVILVPASDGAHRLIMVKDKPPKF